MNKNYFSKKYNVNKKFFQLEKTGLKFIFLFFFLIITNFASGQTTLFQFQFEGNLTPSATNVCAPTPKIEGLSINSPHYYTGACTGLSLGATNWKDNGTPDYYRITVNTTGYEKLYFSYCNYGDNGIGNFISYVSTDGGSNKIPIIGSYTPTNSTTTNTIVTSGVLPDAANNKGSIYLYIQKSGNSGNGNDKFLVDNITLTGTPIADGTVARSTTVCSGTNSTVLTLSGHTAPITRWEFSLNNFATAGTHIANTTSTTYTAIDLTATTSYRAVTKDGTCPERYSAAATVTVNTTAAPTASAQKLCFGSTIANLVATGTELKWYTASTGGTALATTTALVTGTYYVSQTLNTCESTRASTAVTVPVAKTYNNGAWSPDPPTLDNAIIFAGNYISTGNLDGCSCTVNAGVKVLFSPTHTLKIVNGVYVNSMVDTSLTFYNNASLVQINDDSVNEGVISYTRTNNTTRETDYTYWSSPVAGQKLINVSPKTPINYFYSFDAGVNNWIYQNPNNVMTEGKGYIIRGPQYTSIPPTNFYEAPFKGVPNNGNYEVAILVSSDGKSNNLIGNPYPSAIDAESFLRANSSVLQGTLYFWTHNTPIRVTTPGTTNEGSGYYVYISDDYASYNLTGGVGTVAFSDLDKTLSNPKKPTGKIASGQGFFASGKATGKAIFKNSMRVGVGSITGDNKQFFKIPESLKNTNAIEKNRVWLNLTNDKGAFKQVLVGYITDATNGYDNAFDGPNNNGNQFVNFYSINEDKKLTIQGRALPFNENDVVLLGFSSVIQGSFSISIDEVDGLLTSENIYLEDKTNNSIHDLKKSAYTFDTEKGTFDDRFVLRFTNKTLGTGDFELNDNSVLIAKDRGELKIKSQTETISRITVFDLLGRKVFDKEAVNSNEFRTSNITLNKQLVLVKVMLTNGKVISKKVIY